MVFFFFFFFFFFFLQNIGLIVLHVLSAHKTLTFNVIQRNFMNFMRMFKTLI